jgi:hypothetical protein
MLLVVLILMFVLLVVILFYPFYIEFQSDKNQLSFCFYKYIKVSYPLFSSSFNAFERLDKNPKRNLLTEKLLKTNLKKIFYVISSFDISVINLRLNTGSNQLNGILFPIFFIVSFFSRKNISVDFNENTQLYIKAKNNLARLSWAIISSRKHK